MGWRGEGSFPVRRWNAEKRAHCIFESRRVKAEGMARCNEMYTTSYLSITYTRHCVNIVKKYWRDRVYYYCIITAIYHYSNCNCESCRLLLFDLQCVAIAFNETVHAGVRSFASETIFFEDKISAFDVTFEWQSFKFARKTGFRELR